MANLRREHLIALLIILAALLGILLIGSVLAMGIQAVAARRLVQVESSQRAGAARSMLRDGLIGGGAVALATLAISSEAAGSSRTVRVTRIGQATVMSASTTTPDTNTSEPTQ